MQKMKKTLTYALISVFTGMLLGGCSSIKFPGVYKVTIQQGNYLEKDMIDQLEVGLTRQQVRYIMGTPLVEDTFNTNRWDYYYNVKLGDDDLKTNHFTVFFDGDRLVKWEGNYIPLEQQIQQEHKEAIDAAAKEEDAQFK